MGSVIRYAAAGAAASGFCAAVAQVAAARELLAVFWGNELTAGLVFACWVLWTAAGGRCWAALGRRLRPEAAIAVGLGCMAAAFPAALFWIRGARAVLGLGLGEAFPLGDVIVAAFVAVGPLCFVSGWVFGACWAFGSRAGFASPVYLGEALGAGLGGLFAWRAAAGGWPAFAASALTGAVLLAVAMVLARGCGRRIGFGLAGVGLGLTILAGFSRPLELATRRWQWGPELLAVRDTPYNNLAVLGRDAQTTFFANGLWLFTAPDPQTAEFAAHPAMLQRPEPGRVLMLGGVGLPEVLAHPGVARVDYLERDAGLLGLMRERGGRELARALADPRVRTIAEDPALFVRQTKGPYEVIILGMGEPRSAQANRFYTVEFFERVKALLPPEGVFAFFAPASGVVLGPAQLLFLRSLDATLREVFPEVLVLPGESAVFLARKSGKFLATPEEMVAELARRGLHPLYFQDYYLYDQYAPERVAWLRSLLEAPPAPRVNRDLEPTCYFPALAMWSQQYHPALKVALLALAETPAWKVWAVLAAGLAALFLPVFLGRKRRPAAIKACVAVNGCAQMAAGLVLLVAYQIINGDLYGRLALLVAAQMAGLALGAWADGRLRAPSRPLRRLAALQALTVLFPLGLWQVLVLVHGRGGEAASLLAPDVSPPCLALAAGLLGGLHFCAAARAICPADAPESAEAGGRLYAWDLAGAGLGALVLSLAVIPLFGLGAALAVCAGGCALGLIGLARGA